MPAGRAGKNLLPHVAFGRRPPQSNLHYRPTLLFSSFSSIVPCWANVDISTMGKRTEPHNVCNMVNGEWQAEVPSGARMLIPDPMNKNNAPIFTLPDTQSSDLDPFIKSMKACPKSGLHNPLKHNERYLMYGEISRRAGNELKDRAVAEYFAECIMKCVPKSRAQALAEVRVTADFLVNFGGDNVRFLARDFGIPGDHVGQKSVGYRWPYGPVAIIAPFNFPLEIPVLQLMGSLYMGNKPVLKPAEKVAVVMEQYLRLLHHVGMPKKDVDLLNCQGPVAGELLQRAPIRVTQFTGSSRVAELLSKQTNGKVKVEDAGFDWKILGPDVQNVDYIAWQCDQDAYAAQGQKCSAQSMLFCHENWVKAGILEKIKKIARKRNLEDGSNGPVLTHTTEEIHAHKQRLLEVPGARLLFGGHGLTNHDIPEQYGAVEPTAVFVPLEQMLKEEHFDACTSEIFAPFQVVTEFREDQVALVIEACERMSHHLTAAVVSNCVKFQHRILSNTVNGTTYVGIRARTTGAPQNHWFGPAGDPRGAGIGTPEAIKMVWSCHREIVVDELIPDNWVQTKPT